MSNLKDFLTKLQNDETMQNALAQARMDATIAVANKCGFAITENDFKDSKDLSDEDLAAAAGGGLFSLKGVPNQKLKSL